MANAKRIDPRKNFAPRTLPWLLAAAAFVTYWLTLNHWVSLLNYQAVSRVSGWDWQPELYNPLYLMLTWPIRWLPAVHIPAALNLFSAVCAALTLGLLARSVAILPQDRSDAQRDREHSVFGFLTTRSAWLPPVLAVVVCGLQMTFWEHATNGTAEMFELLLFAFVVWSLLEYRLDERERRLFLAAAVLAAGVTESWTLVGFLPLFVVAVVWIRGLSFFNLRFLICMFLSGVAGMLFYLLLPLLTVVSHKVNITFWEALKINLVSSWQAVKFFFTRPEMRKTLLLFSPASLLPLLVIGIRWKSSYGDSKLGLVLTSFMVHVIHATLLVVCVWVAFDPPFSPRHLGFGPSFLTFYYLGALSVGYFAGYFLLIFGKPVSVRSSGGSRMPAREPKPDPFQPLNRLVVAGVWFFAVVAVTGLVYKNLPQMVKVNDDTCKTFGALVAENLPKSGGICLSDAPRRAGAAFVQAALVREGRAGQVLMLDTASLGAPAYHSFLHKKFPGRWPDTISAYEQTNGITPRHLVGLMAMVAKTNSLYYLNPSFGYYFEQFYLEPHGLVYQLKTLPGDTLLPLPPDHDLVAANEAFWSRVQASSLEPVIRAIASSDLDTAESIGEKLLRRFHVMREPNPNATLVGRYYSCQLNFWGVVAQRASDWKTAASDFETALRLNPDNVAARVNRDFNRSLQAGQSVPVDPSKATTDQFGKYYTWDALLGDDGPFDEPSFTLEYGMILMQGGLARQAVAPFHRVMELAPDNLLARLWLAQSYLATRLPDLALEALRGPLTDPDKFALAGTDSSQINILAASAYFQKKENVRGIELVQTEISRHPTNDVLWVTATQVYLRLGLYTNALSIIDQKLQSAPDDPTWLFGKGFASIQIKDYDTGISALTHVLTIQTTNVDARFNRAIAYLQTGQLDAARADYEQLGLTFTNSYQIPYGLGEIAWRKHETNEAIKQYQLYLATANTNTAEATNIIERLKALKR